MTDIKPIETVYNGYRFRSRLEARWAVFFDALGVNYEYEPEGYVLSDGSRYLPDFYLPDLRIYVEVKPRGAFSIEFKDGMAVWPQGTNRYAVFSCDIAKAGFGAWFVFGDPQDAIIRGGYDDSGDNYLFCLCRCSAKHLSKNDEDVCICEGKEQPIAQCKMAPFMACGPVVSFCADWVVWGIDEKLVPTEVKAIPFCMVMEVLERNGDDDEFQAEMKDQFIQTISAAREARQARFEYGETPRL